MFPLTWAVPGFTRGLPNALVQAVPHGQGQWHGQLSTCVDDWERGGDSWNSPAYKDILNQTTGSDHLGENVDSKEGLGPCPEELQHFKFRKGRISNMLLCSSQSGRRNAGSVPEPANRKVSGAWYGQREGGLAFKPTAARTELSRKPHCRPLSVNKKYPAALNVALGGVIRLANIFSISWQSLKCHATF